MKKAKSEFEKAINFQMGFKPNTLINKLSAAQIVLKNEMKSFVSDGYLDVDESDSLFNMIGQFNSKVCDVYDFLKLDEVKNKTEIELTGKIVEQLITMFCDILNVSIDGCNAKSVEHSENAKNQKKPFLFGVDDYNKKVNGLNYMAQLESKR